MSSTWLPFMSAVAVISLTRTPICFLFLALLPLPSHLRFDQAELEGRSVDPLEFRKMVPLPFSSYQTTPPPSPPPLSLSRSLCLGLSLISAYSLHVLYPRQLSH